jgi:hypothetical protein
LREIEYLEQLVEEGYETDNKSDDEADHRDLKKKLYGSTSNTYKLFLKSELRLLALNKMLTMLINKRRVNGSKEATVSEVSDFFGSKRDCQLVRLSNILFTDIDYYVALDYVFELMADPAVGFIVSVAQKRRERSEIRSVISGLVNWYLNERPQNEKRERAADLKTVSDLKSE